MFEIVLRQQYEIIRFFTRNLGVRYLLLGLQEYFTSKKMEAL